MPAEVTKFRAAGVGTVVSFRVTGTVAGFTPGVVLESAIDPLYVPPAIPPGLAATDTEPGVVPLAVDALFTVSQLWLLVAVNCTAELGETDIPRVCVLGTAEFTELKVSDVGAGTRLDVTVRFTVTVGVVLALLHAPE